MRYDLVIDNAVVIDGTGQPAYRAGVAVRGDRISAIGEIVGEARRRIDAGGRTLIPGIIDPHSHADLILPLGPEKQGELMRCKIAQGITTTIVGNCGLGCAPLSGPETESILRSVNSWMTPRPFEWSWRTFGEYLSRIEDGGLLLNIGSLIPHGPVRISAMGLSPSTPTRRQLREMGRMVRQAMRDGAFGLSTGLIYPPGMYSAPDELKALASVAAEFGGIYTSHIRGSSETLIRAVAELLEVGRETGVRVHHSHNEAVGRDNWSKAARVLEMEEEAESEGLKISFDMFPYTAAATMMIAIYPPWALEGGVDGLVRRLTDTRLRAKIRRDIELKTPSWPPWKPGGWPHNLVKATGWDSIFIGYVEGRKNKRLENRSLAELGEMAGKSPFDAVSDLIVEESGQVSMLIFEVSGERDEVGLLARYAAHRLCAFCTDAEDYGRGLPHPAAYGAFPRIVSSLVRGAKVLSLEQAVRKMTAYPASIFGIRDRGTIRPGAFADLAIINPEKISDRATYKNPRREATGIDTVIINGNVIFEEGELRSVSQGRLLRLA